MEFADERAEDVARESQRVRVQSLDVEELVQLAADRTGNTVLEVANLATSLDGSAAPQVEQAVLEAEAIVADLKQRSFEPLLQRAEKELASVSCLLSLSWSVST